MARYIIEEMPDLQKTGKRITYPLIPQHFDLTLFISS